MRRRWMNSPIWSRLPPGFDRPHFFREGRTVGSLRFSSENRMLRRGVQSAAVLTQKVVNNRHFLILLRRNKS